MPGENSNPYQYTKTVDQIIVERNNAKAKARADLAAAQEKAKKSNQLQNLYTQINEYRRLITLKERDISVTEAAIKTAQQAGDTGAVDVGIGVLNAQRADLAKLKASETQKNNERKSIVAGLVEANKAAVNVAIQTAGFNKDDVKTNNKKSKIKPAQGDIPTAPPPPPAIVYNYNIPMISSEYFRDKSPQAITVPRGVSGPGNFTDAEKMFKSEGSSKGTIQTSRDLASSAVWKNKSGEYRTDLKMYGFKFLYNPTEVSMGWGMLEGVDPNPIRTNATGGLAPVSGVGLSTIDFTLLLNRTSDMNYLDENGLAPGENPDGPYPGINPIEKVQDLKMIYQRGTMYDLEYLFRVINGPSAIHKTRLNGESADWGFLIGTQVELYLGDGLRYLVRLNGINVNHRIFNDRMVPVISEVSISCGRYNDVGLKVSEDGRE